MLQDIQQGISRVQVNMEEMHKSIRTLNRQAHTANHASSRQMPTKPSIFYGRDAFVAEVADILINADPDSKPPRICIRGPGGMGKDVLCSRSDGRFSHPPQVWRQGPILGAMYLCDIPRSPTPTPLQQPSHLIGYGDYLADIITELKSSSLPRLMLLDNFETPWDPVEGSREHVEDILTRLSALSQLSILVTMRTNIPPSGANCMGRQAAGRC